MPTHIVEVHVSEVDCEYDGKVVDLLDNFGQLIAAEEGTLVGTIEGTGDDCWMSVLLVSTVMICVGLSVEVQPSSTLGEVAGHVFEVPLGSND